MTKPAPFTEAEDAAGRRLYQICMREGLVNDLRGWEEYHSKQHDEMGEWDVWIPALPEKEKLKWRRAALALANPESSP